MQVGYNQKRGQFCCRTVPQGCMPNYEPGYPKCNLCGNGYDLPPIIIDTKELHFHGFLCKDCEKKIKTDATKRTSIIIKRQVEHEQFVQNIEYELSKAAAEWGKKFSPREVEKRIVKYIEITGLSSDQINEAPRRRHIDLLKELLIKDALNENQTS